MLLGSLRMRDREVVVGTGGKGPTGTSATPKPFSQAHSSPAFGALVLTLHPTGYDWSFRSIAGYTFTDSGSFGCH